MLFRLAHSDDLEVTNRFWETRRSENKGLSIKFSPPPRLRGPELTVNLYPSRLHEQRIISEHIGAG